MPREGMDYLESMNYFTPGAQQVLAFAREEADRFNHSFVGTEHVLLGLIRLGRGVAVNVLTKMGVNLETVRKKVESVVGTGPDQKIIGNIPYTPRVKKVLALAAKEARALNHTYVGTEHILLGLLREGDGVAARVLNNLDVDVEQTRKLVLQELDPNFGQETTDAEALGGPPEPSKPQTDSMDISKRYDIYCSEKEQGVVVYRNALFKGKKKLFPQTSHDFLSEFLEIEQADGKTMFLSRHSVIKFCEHGVTPGAESVSTEK